MAITAQMVKELREKTDAPMMDCKKALEASGGDINAAIDWLRTRGVAKAEKKAGREMAEGRVESYIHSNAKVGVLLEMHCETDFASRNEAFSTVMKDICMHIAAADPAPIALDEAAIPAEMLQREKEIYEGQAKESGKPEQFWPKIIDGRMDKFKKSVALMEQSFVKRPDIKVKDLVTELVAKLGENISVARFIKFRIGE